MTDAIRIEEVRGCSVYGVLAEEKLRTQPFVVDIEVEVESTTIDSIECTVSYADIAADAPAVIEGENTDLIETLADRIVERALACGALRAAVAVHKSGVPVGVSFSDVSVTVRRNSPSADGGAVCRAVLVLGSNLGGGHAHLDVAVEAPDTFGLHLTVVSDCLSTDPLPVPGQESQPRYTNVMATVTTVMLSLAPLAKP